MNERLKTLRAALERGDHALIREQLARWDVSESVLSEEEKRLLERAQLVLRHDNFGLGIAMITGVTLVILALLLF